jgi:hypothetical protein
MKYKIAVGEFPEPKRMQLFGAPRDAQSHQGHDLANGVNFQCKILKNGRIVKRAYNSTAGYSFWVEHTDGTRSLYCHITKSSYNTIPDGLLVKAGQFVGVAGNTGNATAIVLHYEYHINRKPVDPLPYIIEENEEMQTGKPIKSIGQVQANGAPELINNEGNKSGNYTKPNDIIPFNAFRTSKFTDGGQMVEFRSVYEPVWIHINDVKPESIIWGHVDAEKTIQEQKKLAAQIIKA